MSELSRTKQNVALAQPHWTTTNCDSSFSDLLPLVSSSRTSRNSHVTFRRYIKAQLSSTLPS